MLGEHQIQPVFEMINGTDMPRFLVQNIAQAQEMLEAVQTLPEKCNGLLSHGNDG